MADDDHCISCARAVSSAQQKFCPDCGQATPPSRIDWQYVGNELQHGVLQMDRGILYSLKELMLSPGTLLRDYIQGRRGNQAKPLLLITLMAAVVVLLSRVLPDAPLLERVPAAGEVPAVMARFLAASEVVNGWITGHFAAFTLMLLPVEAAVKCWVFRRYSRLNYPEWLVITTLLTVQALVIWSLLLPLQRWIPQQPWLGVLVMIYGSASLLQFFCGRPLWSTLWRVLLGYALFVLIAQVLLNAAIVVLMLR